MVREFFRGRKLYNGSAVSFLYIETLGSYSDGFTAKWSGYVFGVTFLMAFWFLLFGEGSEINTAIKKSS